MKRRADGHLASIARPFNDFHWASLVVPRDHFWGENLFRRFPRIVRVRVPLPLDQILKSPISPVIAVVRNGLHLELLFSVDKVRGWSRVVGPVLIGLLIRGQQTCVKYVMDGPGRGKG